MRSTLQLATLLALPLACGGPLPAAESEPHVAASAALPDAASNPDAGARGGDSFHTMTVTLCSRAKEVCGGNDSSTTYRVAFGDGAGSVRSHAQARADLYREVRDRTGMGTRLVAASHHLEPLHSDAASLGPTVAARPTSSDADPLVQIAFDLMDSVDQDGQLTLDVAHGHAECKLSLVNAALATESRRCLLREPARPGSRDDEGTRQPERRLGP